VIRQAISCDICGTEKRQTNHWFVAYEQGGELRVSGWTSRRRSRAGSKHLCGQTCLHKLVDDFIAKSMGSRPRFAEEGTETEPVTGPANAGPSATSVGEEIESSARLIVSAPSSLSRPAPNLPPDLIVVSAHPNLEIDVPVPDEPPPYSSRAWRAEAWQRERERELRAGERSLTH
jgi:hypothetical protein